MEQDRTVAGEPADRLWQAVVDAAVNATPKTDPGAKSWNGAGCRHGVRYPICFPAVRDRVRTGQASRKQGN